MPDRDHHQPDADGGARPGCCVLSWLLARARRGGSAGALDLIARSGRSLGETAWGMSQHGRGLLAQPAELRRVADWLKVGFAASKLSRPVVRPGSVRRLALIDRLRKSGSFPVMSVVAPAGYGKTTLLSQWAESNGQPFAWVSLDERDNDPKVLLTYVAEALDAVEPIGQRVFDALASPWQLGARLGGAPAGGGVGLDDLAGGAGPGRCARAPRSGMPGRHGDARRPCAQRLSVGAGRAGRAASARRAAARRRQGYGDRPW